MNFYVNMFYFNVQETENVVSLFVFLPALTFCELSGCVCSYMYTLRHTVSHTHIPVFYSVISVIGGSAFHAVESVCLYGFPREIFKIWLLPRTAQCKGNMKGKKECILRNNQAGTS